MKTYVIEMTGILKGFRSHSELKHNVSIRAFNRNDATNLATSFWRSNFKDFTLVKTNVLEMA